MDRSPLGYTPGLNRCSTRGASGPPPPGAGPRPWGRGPPAASLSTQGRPAPLPGRRPAPREGSRPGPLGARPPKRARTPVAPASNDGRRRPRWPGCGHRSSGVSMFPDVHRRWPPGSSPPHRRTRPAGTDLPALRVAPHGPLPAGETRPDPVAGARGSSGNEPTAGRAVPRADGSSPPVRSVPRAPGQRRRTRCCRARGPAPSPRNPRRRKRPLSTDAGGRHAEEPEPSAVGSTTHDLGSGDDRMDGEIEVPTR